MPDRREGEAKDAFVERCMSSEEAQRDFPDPDARLGFCLSKAEEVSASDDMTPDCIRRVREQIQALGLNVPEQFAEGDEFTLRNVEIFATGTWHAAVGGKITVTGDDLEDLVTSFRSINQIGGFRPMLKLGHDHKLGDGAPSLGFVENVRRVGDKVVADFVDVARPLFDLIKAGRYTQVSIEMLRSAKFAGQKFRNVLTAVAILGASMPAVKGLSDLRDSLLKSGKLPEQLEGEVVALTQGEEEDMPKDATYTQEQHDALVEKAVNEAVDREKAQFSAEKTALETERDALKARAEGAEKALQTFTAEQADKDITALVDGAIKDGKWLPKDRDTLLAHGRALASVSKFGDGEEDGMAGFKRFCEGLPKVVAVDVETGASGRDSGDAKGAKPAAQEIAERQQKLIADGKADDHGAAFRMALSEADEDLKNRYLKGE